MTTGRFAGRVAIVTGAAAGIGEAVADLLAAEGARVAIVDIDAGRLANAAKRLRAAGRDVLPLEASVLSAVEVDRVVASVLRSYERIDILVNNVGGSSVIASPNRELCDLTFDEWEQTLRFNLHGTFLCCRAVIPHMKRQRYGRIVNLSSILARGNVRLSNAAYITAKAGLRAFTRKLAMELGRFGITCNATAPGATLTERILRVRQSTAGDPSQQLEDSPLGRAASPEEQARAIAFLASDDAAFISGQTIEVTGGA
jgi:NAD(P)-dependent dehydrogenase (short-subunit alcohol dehydrogenase family)